MDQGTKKPRIAFQKKGFEVQYGVNDEAKEQVFVVKSLSFGNARMSG